ncbi:MAG: hypothetical protein PUD20_00245 [bacterium]|nr:hypothetical protein [bacterium]
MKSYIIILPITASVVVVLPITVMISHQVTAGGHATPTEPATGSFFRMHGNI